NEDAGRCEKPKPAANRPHILSFNFSGKRLRMRFIRESQVGVIDEIEVGERADKEAVTKQPVIANLDCTEKAPVVAFSVIVQSSLFLKIVIPNIFILPPAMIMALLVLLILLILAYVDGV